MQATFLDMHIQVANAFLGNRGGKIMYILFDSIDEMSRNSLFNISSYETFVVKDDA